MDLTIMHLWAAGHDLPPEPVRPTPPPATVEPRRGKKAGKAKRRKAGK